MRFFLNILYKNQACRPKSGVNYYPHGPLARVEYGNDKVQGMDYAYTLQGWIKGINSTTLNTERDMGKDAWQDVSNINKHIAIDAMSYSLNYYQGDYKAIDYIQWNDLQKRFESTTFGSELMAGRYNLYNGNISSMVTTLSRLDTLVPSGLASVPLPLPQGNVYKYDQLNRITESKTYNNIDLPNNHWLSSGQTISNMYTNNFTYEANGNILTQTRYDNLGAQHDNMVYRYWKDASGDMIHNRLYHVNDNTAYTSLRTDDIDDQGYYTNHEDSVNVYNNYSYDAIGNLVKDSTEQIDSIEWTVYGKIKRITRVTGSTKDNLAFDYDASGNRIAKHILDNSNQWKRTTYYVRDAQGNIMSTYEHTIDDTVLSYAQTEKHLYGSSRLGMDNTENEMLGAVASADATPIPHYQGYKRYELSNHLGNVMSTITDRKIAVDTVGNDTISFYIADIMSQYDYYPFGVIKTNRLCTYDTVGTITDTLLYEPFDSGTGGFTTVSSATLSNSSSQLQATCACASKGQHSFGASKEISLTNGVSYTISYSLDVVCGASIRVILKNPSGVAVDSTVKTSTGTYTINYTPSSSGTYNLEFYKLSPGSACGFLIDNLLVTSLGYDVVADCDGIEGFGNYRYGMNTQEKVDEISGSGNHYTAEFWEYDPRTGRRWNTDPKPDAWESPYVAFANNPILFTDILGDTEDERKKAVEKAKDYKDKSTGTSASYGGKGDPGKAVDCSGLVSKCVQAADLPNPNQGSSNGVTNIANNSTKVEWNDVQEGNAVTFNGNKHIGIISGNIKKDENGNVISFNVIGSQSSTGPGEFTVQVDKSAEWKNGNDGYWSPKLGAAYKWDTNDDGTSNLNVTNTSTTTPAITNGNSNTTKQATMQAAVSVMIPIEINYAPAVSTQVVTPAPILPAVPVKKKK